MNLFLEWLSKLMPVWAAVGLVGFGYLVILIKRASDRFLDIATAQATFMRERVDVVDKSTVIFQRTIDQQEKEVKHLTEQLSKLRVELQTVRETEARLSMSELKLISSGMERLLEAQEAIEVAVRTSVALPPSKLINDELRSDIEKAIRARDLSIYPVSVAPMPGAEEFVETMREAGFAASIYHVSEDDPDDTDDNSPAASRAIWLGSEVPPDVAVTIIRMARAAYPFLSYIHLSGDAAEPEETYNETFIGGATESAEGFLALLPWSSADFAALSPDMSIERLHAHVRGRYKPTAERLAKTK